MRLTNQGPAMADIAQADAAVSEAAMLRASLDGAGSAAAEALPFRLDDYVGYSYRGKPILDQEGIIGQIDSGREIEGDKITYTFLDKDHAVGLYNNPNYGFSEPYGLSVFSEAQRETARDGMELWDDLIPQDIVESNGMGSDIVFANTVTGPAQAWAYYPGNGPKYQSDVWIATPEANWSNDWLQFSGYGRTTIIHEAGHALGLSHPGSYNYDPELDLTYDNYAEYAQDSEMFSIMSYWGPQETGAPLIVNWLTGFYSYAQTPMIHDILTMQAKYGADTTTRSGDTVYFSNSTADRDVFDLDVNPFPYLAVYDAGGEDTFDFSDADAGVFVDLRPGSFSSAAGDIPTAAEANVARAEMDEFYPGTLPPRTQATMDGIEASYKPVYASLIEGDTGVAGVTATSHSNIGVAYGTIIENAIGGSERDYLVGNDVDNGLTGNGGNDVLNGLGGNDTLTGGEGADSFVIDQVGGMDMLTDFTSGEDQIDLSAFGIDASAVTFEADRILVDIDGDSVADLGVITQGDAIQATDILFV